MKTFRLSLIIVASILATALISACGSGAGSTSSGTDSLTVSNTLLSAPTLRNYSTTAPATITQNPKIGYNVSGGQVAPTISFTSATVTPNSLPVNGEVQLGWNVVYVSSSAYYLLKVQFVTYDSRGVPTFTPLVVARAMGKPDPTITTLSNNQPSLGLALTDSETVNIKRTGPSTFDLGSFGVVTVPSFDSSSKPAIALTAELAESNSLGPITAVTGTDITFP